ncbi:ABC transporter ATP-binding protein [Actinoallomurus rhizosphaericola]|uniref:ABC transporter ATP-binding protein n=1 Tax=Actinoallomurus rhizosphaericola TaxID=2952536 RepID=UPI00209319F2|nr:ATP-binding cassette domain-containing protein [Actinoallomurus rhizosphaericola]MCO5995146.1 ABC transporter ATP-binding protein/permease [Actinoallomurus rhizosphaericola]
MSPPAALRDSPRYRVLKALAAGSPGLLTGAVVFMLAEGLIPNLVLIAMGRTVGAIPAAVRSGLGGHDGEVLLSRLTVAGLVYAVSLLRGPAEDVLTAMVQAKMSAVQQERLIEAVSAPAGITHLEDPDVLDRLASARGELSAYQPAGAAMTLIGQLGDRLSGVIACAVLASFRWWLGLGLFVMWLLVRRPLQALVRARIATFRKATEPLRRSWYYLHLAFRPAAAKEVRVFGLGPWLVGNYRERNTEAMRPASDEMRALNGRIAASTVLILAGYGIAAVALGTAAYDRSLPLGTLVTMLTMLPATMQVGGLTAADVAVETMLSSVPDLDALTTDLRPAPLPAGGGRPVAGRPHREIRFEGVSFRYPGTDRNVLDGLDLVLEAGRSTAVVGVNGAGKSTLISLLAALRTPTEGRVLVDGVPLEEFPVRDWQRHVAAVFQDFTRLPLTARENVTMGLGGEPADPEVLAAVARRAGASELVADLPDGWDTVLSAQYDGGRDLSGGQWQRIALARALYAVERGAGVLVLDEPTAQLDVRAEARFYDRFLTITEGVTSLIISHRFSTVRKADRIAVLDGGRITEYGGHDELLRAGGTYAEMFRIQAARFAPNREARR